MPEEKKIKAPAKILVGLRFKNKCIVCGRIILSDRNTCNTCLRKKINQIKKQQKNKFI